MCAPALRQRRVDPERAQLRITDADGMRITAFVTNTTRGQLADLKLRHRRRARAADRIRCAKDTGMMNLPLHDLDQNPIVALASKLIAWLQILALVGHDARRWEPKRLRLRLFSAAGRLARSGRATVLHLARAGRWTALLLPPSPDSEPSPAPPGKAPTTPSRRTSEGPSSGRSPLPVAGPTPYGLLLAALGACTSITLRMYVERQMPARPVEEG